MGFQDFVPSLEQFRRGLPQIDFQIFNVLLICSEKKSKTRKSKKIDPKVANKRVNNKSCGEQSSDPKIESNAEDIEVKNEINT